MNLQKINARAYFLINKKTQRVTFGPLNTRREARELKQENEQIVQLAPTKIVR